MSIGLIDRIVDELAEIPPSVAAFLAIRQAAPRCYALVLNRVWDRAEDMSIAAMFDTPEALTAYEQSARLPDGGAWVDHPSGRQIHRTYREDSVLWDFNPPGGFYEHIILAPFDFDYTDTPINPELP